VLWTCAARRKLAIGGRSPYQFKENHFPTMVELRKAVPNRPLIVQYALMKTIYAGVMARGST
jgi:hypothetical protein